MGPSTLCGLCRGVPDDDVLILQDERWYLSTAYTRAEIQQTLDAVDRALR